MAAITLTLWKKGENFATKEDAAAEMEQRRTHAGAPQLRGLDVAKTVFRSREKLRLRLNE
jgi:hypothetical protein